MHVRKGVWASILIAFILGTFALPLAGLTLTPATPAAAATPTAGVATGPGGTATAWMASSGTAVAFNLLGTPDTAIFQCGPTASVGGGTTATTTGITPGCYDVTGSASTEFTGAGAGVNGGTCGGQTATASGSAVNCAGVASPLCPSDVATAGITGTPGTCGSNNSAGTGCAATLATACSQATLSLNPNSPASFSITFTYWIPFAGPAAGCTAAGGINFATTATRSITVAPFEFPVVAPAGSGFCQFSVTVEKKYVEITSLTLTPVGTCHTTSPLLFAEGLKQFFGSPCTFHVTAAGIVNIKPEPASGCPTGSPGAPFGAGATYVCQNGVLSVKIPDVTVAPYNLVVPITAVTSGPITAGTATTGATLNSLCGGTTGTIATTSDNFIVCPTGPGVASVKACLAPGTFPDTQPTNICSAPFTITFTLPGAARVVPYVRWAGEKQVLTKCFGGALHNAGALVEFTLASGGSDAAQATLIPAALGGTAGTVGPSGGGAAVGTSTQNTVFTTTDANGCATVILFAAGEGQVNVDASLFATTPAAGTTVGTPLINEHVFTVFYLKFDHVDMENVKLTTYSSATLTSPVNSLGFTASGATALPAGFPAEWAGPAASFVLPNPPGSNPQPAGGYPVPLCGVDYVRALVHGYFEIPGDPSGRPASTVAIPGAPTNAASSYVLPAGRWVLPEDWPVLATFAGFISGAPNDNPVSSVFAWDLNSGWVFNPGGERADLCEGPALPTNAAGTVTGTPPDLSANTVGTINNAYPTTPYSNVGNASYNAGGGSVSYGPCYGIDVTPTAYSTAPNGPNCAAGVTVGIGPFDATQACTNPYPIDFSPSGSSVLCDNVVTPCPAGTNLGASPGAVAVVPLGPNSTFLPNGTLNEWDAPMPPAQVTFNITGGPGFFDQVNKTGLYAIPTVNSAGATTPTAIYPDPFYAEAIPASPLIPPILNNGGYLWDTWGFRGGTTLAPTVGAGTVAGTALVTNPFVPVGGLCPTPYTAVTSGDTTACFVGTANTASTSVTAAECASVGGTFTAVDTTVTPATGTCQITTLPTAANIAAGTTTSFVGSTCPATVAGVPVTNSAGLAIDTSVDVADASAFAVGDTITLAGQTLTITAITGNTLTFNTAVNGCITPGSASVVGNTVTVTLASAPPAGTVAVGTNIELTTTTASVSTSVVAVSGATITLANAAAIAQALAGCTLGAAGCTVVVPAGTLLTTGATGGQAPVLCAPGQTATVTPGTTDADTGAVINPATTACAATPSAQGPYPFWQFVPNASTGSTTNPSATVYSDNHGEAIVSLETGIAASVAPVNGACPAGYSPTPTAAAPTNCLLNLGALGVASTSPNGVAFPNVKAALAAFSASAPGCIQTSSSGAVVAPTATATSTTPAPAVGATGPLPGQICVNKLGGVEFGAGATLGTTTLNAIADYPYVRGVHPPISSGSITKVFTSMFAKTVTVTPLSATTGCTPGTTGCGIPGPAGTTEFNVIITATDICGNPIVGEPVNVFALGNAGAIVLGALGSGAIQNGSNSATVFTGANGTATLSLEVLNSALGTQGLVIKAVFPLEALERFVTVVPGTSGATATVLYTPGYNMVGGPPGSNFSSVEALFNFNPATNSYGNATASAPNISSAPPTCTGYFAYFAAAMAVSLPVNGTAGQTAACTLGAGWNLVGNPFSTPANIQSGVTAYYWNPTSQSYVTVSQIPTGGAVFIFNDGTLNTVTLTAT